MTKKILTTKFSYSIATGEMKKIMPAVAAGFSNIAGCCWKIWIINEERKEAGGVYLFESQDAMTQYLNGVLFASVKNNPAFSNLQTGEYNVEEAASAITGAPLF